jgi:hypothetical protein
LIPKALFAYVMLRVVTGHAHRSRIARPLFRLIVMELF